MDDQGVNDENVADVEVGLLVECTHAGAHQLLCQIHGARRPVGSDDGLAQKRGMFWAVNGRAGFSRAGAGVAFLRVVNKRRP